MANFNMLNLAFKHLNVAIMVQNVQDCQVV